MSHVRAQAILSALRYASCDAEAIRVILAAAAR